MKLTEGADYSFVLRKLVQLEDEPAFWLLRSPEGINYTLEAAMYEHYNFVAETEIICRVDKINCSGKVFLEPQHPIYREKQLYPFIVRNRISEIENEITIEVEDVLGKNIRAIVHHSTLDHAMDGKVVLQVNLLRKGLPILNDPAIVSRMVFEERKLYSFTIVSRIDEAEPQYLLIDEAGKSHLLQTGNFEAYGFEPGKMIQCEVARVHSDGTLTLEPVSPHYKSGDVLDLIITDRFQLPAGNGEYHDLFKLTQLDGSGEFHLSTRFVPDASAGFKIQCKVDRIKKGVPYLIPV